MKNQEQPMVRVRGTGVVYDPAPTAAAQRVLEEMSKNLPETKAVQNLRKPLSRVLYNEGGKTLSVDAKSGVVFVLLDLSGDRRGRNLWIIVFRQIVHQYFFSPFKTNILSAFGSISAFSTFSTQSSGAISSMEILIAWGEQPQLSTKALLMAATPFAFVA